MPRKTPGKSKTSELEQTAQLSGENTTLGLQYDRHTNNTLTRVLPDNPTTDEPTAQTLPRRGPGRPSKTVEQNRAKAAERARKYRNRKKEKNENNQREAEGSGVGDTAAASDETAVSDQRTANGGIGPSEIQADTGDAMEELRRQLMNVIVTSTQDNIAIRATTEEADNANKSLEGLVGISMIYYIVPCVAQMLI